MRIAICDDDRYYTDYIIMEINRNMEEQVYITRYNEIGNVESCVKDLAAQDIVFMDIEIGEVNGIDLAERIIYENPLAMIVFISAYDKYISNVFRGRPIGFMKKPFDSCDIFTHISRAKSMLGANHIYKYVVGNNILRLVTSDIIYIQSIARRLTICSSRREDVIYKKLDELEEELKELDKTFLRISKSCLVNTRYVIAKKKSSIDVNCNREVRTLYISRNYEKLVNRWYIEAIKNGEL